ncbi:bifunctional metallophosphatase/5'-nucleotidase [Kineococcus rubinsiae]|uniref:bifunctional metallophosphatase/5'-nucleotidase n=1 Tax=Kineococcus rubinsiae TaxID=2609562 RepID=UPI0014304F1C|nr:bifunctional UDP-sugar hydrolase/5'-nucleotidase [Kineococcus rubinsiae]NIZ91982.1 bifunctional metallophosphatase/5'-nucleotidase [Kineococcus rubinsiae]
MTLRTPPPVRTRAAGSLAAATLAAAALAGLGAAPASAATAAPPAAGVVAPVLPAPAAGQTQIQIGAFNDLHGRLEAPEETDDGQPIGGTAQLAGALDAMRAQQPNTLVLSAGDNIGASTFTSFIQQDAPTLAALNAMGVVASAVGNHEFDRGYADLVQRVGVEGQPGAAGAPPLADFPYLGANVLVRSTGRPAMPGYAVTDVGGVRVGVVGVVTQQTPSLVAPDGIADLQFTDPVAAANAVATQLSDGDAANDEADVVVLLAHEGSSGTDCAGVGTEGAFGQIVQGASPQIDAIVSGHTHMLYDCEFPVAGKAVPRPVVSAASYSTAVDRLVLNVDDATGDVVAQAHQVLPVEGFTPNATVAGIVSDAVAFAATVGAQPVGRITADITRAFAGGETDRGTPSPLGNLIADAQLQQTAGADAQIAFENPGGIRDDLLFKASGSEGDGVVTYAEAAAVQPFANSVVTLSLTGAQVREVLEQQWQPAGSSRPFLALGVSKGFAFTYDPAAPAGAHVVSATLDGAELDAAATYRVTVNSFLAAGGDNFTTLAEGTDRAELGRTDLEAFTAYLGLPENQGLAPDETPRASVAVPAPGPVPSPSAPVVPAPVVPAPAPSASASAPAPAPVAVGSGGRLPTTGVDVAPLLAAGGALVLSGSLVLTAARRRRTRV